MKYRVALFGGSSEQELLSSLAVFLAVKYSVRFPSELRLPERLPAGIFSVLAANELLFHARTLLERHTARKTVLKWLSFEPRFPSLQELVRGAKDTKPHEFAFEGPGAFRRGAGFF